MTLGTLDYASDVSYLDATKAPRTVKQVHDTCFHAEEHNSKQQITRLYSTVDPKPDTTISVNQELLPSIYCSSCKTVFRKPLQLNCGHRLCQKCVDSFDGDVVSCLECDGVCPKKQTTLDRGLCIDNQNTVIVCSSCAWKGIYKDYEGHFRNVHETKNCSLCQTPIESKIKSDQHYLDIEHQKCINIAALRISKKESSHCTSHVDQSELIADSIGAATDITRLMSEGVQSLEQEKNRTHDLSVGMQQQLVTLEHESSRQKISIEEQDTYMKGQKFSSDILYEYAASFRDDVEDHQQTTYDGTYVWIIQKFKKKIADSRSGRQTSFYSPPFYSSPTGYKMRARLYPNGDGNVRGSHMSIFFVLMRGPHDSILKFPFNQKVTFCLYDQTSAHNHRVDSFRPDIKSNSFQRATSEMNIASGIPKFAPLSIIEQIDSPYVRNDTMFIKIMVDFDDMPKTILPYLLALDPGLPTHVQQVLCREELERRSKEEVKKNPLETIEVK